MVVVGGLQDFLLAPGLFGLNWVLVSILTWLGLGLGDLGAKGLGPGLDKNSELK